MMAPPDAAVLAFPARIKTDVVGWKEGDEALSRRNARDSTISSRRNPRVTACSDGISEKRSPHYTRVTERCVCVVAHVIDELQWATTAKLTQMHVACAMVSTVRRALLNPAVIQQLH